MYYGTKISQVYWVGIGRQSFGLGFISKGQKPFPTATTNNYYSKYTVYPQDKLALLTILVFFVLQVVLVGYTVFENGINGSLGVLVQIKRVESEVPIQRVNFSIPRMKYQELLDKYTHQNSDSTSDATRLNYALAPPLVGRSQQYTRSSKSKSKNPPVDSAFKSSSTGFRHSPHRYGDALTSMAEHKENNVFAQTNSYFPQANRKFDLDSNSMNLRKTASPGTRYRDIVAKQLQTSSHHLLEVPAVNSGYDSPTRFAPLQEGRDVNYEVQNYLREREYQKNLWKESQKYDDKKKLNQSSEVTQMARKPYYGLSQSAHMKEKQTTPSYFSPLTSSVGFMTKSTHKLPQHKPKLNQNHSIKTISTDKSHVEEMFSSNGHTAINLSKADFNIGKCRGDGKFGKVFACRHIKTGSLFALKQIPKKIIKQNMMEQQFTRQVKLQSFFNHSNIVKLYGFFSDQLNIYLLMEFMEEGSMYNLLKNKKKFAQDFVAHRIFQVCSGLRYLHDMDVVHRDIKLQNVVLSNGVAKLCDFGWAATINGRRTTYCGTFDYAPPQIIEGKEYNQNVDLWSLGVMTYQMLTGQLPFYNISRSETIKNILNVDQRKITFPPGLSHNAQSFVLKLLRKNPDERVDIGSLLKHPFLQGCSKNRGIL